MSYEEIPCWYKPDCTVKHLKYVKDKGKVDRIDVWKSLTMAPSYFLYLAPFGCFGDRQIVSNCGEVVITTDPHKHFGGRGPAVWVDHKFLNTTPHVLVDELL